MNYESLELFHKENGEGDESPSKEVAMGYAERKAYEEGLKGRKPWGRGLAPELYDAQMEGYKQCLANKNLAEAISDEVEERSPRRSRRDDDDDSDEDERPYFPSSARYRSSGVPSPATTPAPPTPVSPEQRMEKITEKIFWAVFLLVLDAVIAASFIGTMARGGARDFQQPEMQVFAFFVYFFLFPGGFFIWGAVKRLKEAKLLKGGRWWI